MELAYVVVFGAAGLALAIWGYGVLKKRAPSAPAPVSLSPAAKKPWQTYLPSLTTMAWRAYVLIFIVMVMLLILPPAAPVLTRIGAVYQDIAILMMTIGLILLFAIEKGRKGIFFILLGYGILAFNSPNGIARGINTAQQNGVLSAITTNTPTIAQPIETMVWQAGQTYSLKTDSLMRGIIPPDGVIFDQPNHYCVQAKSESAPDIKPILTGAGFDDLNKWSQTRVQPGAGDTEGLISIRVTKKAHC